MEAARRMARTVGRRQPTAGWGLPMSRRSPGEVVWRVSPQPLAVSMPRRQLQPATQSRAGSAFRRPMVCHRARCRNDRSSQGQTQVPAPVGRDGRASCSSVAHACRGRHERHGPRAHAQYAWRGCRGEHDYCGRHGQYPPRTAQPRPSTPPQWRWLQVRTGISSAGAASPPRKSMPLIRAVFDCKSSCGRSR